MTKVLFVGGRMNGQVRELPYIGAWIERTLDFGGRRGLPRDSDPITRPYHFINEIYTVSGLGPDGTIMVRYAGLRRVGAMARSFDPKRLPE